MEEQTKIKVCAECEHSWPRCYVIWGVPRCTHPSRKMIDTVTGKISFPKPQEYNDKGQCLLWEKWYPTKMDKWLTIKEAIREVGMGISFCLSFAFLVVGTIVGIPGWLIGTVTLGLVFIPILIVFGVDELFIWIAKCFIRLIKRISQ